MWHSPLRWNCRAAPLLLLEHRAILQVFPHGVGRCRNGLNQFLSGHFIRKIAHCGFLGIKVDLCLLNAIKPFQGFCDCRRATSSVKPFYLKAYLFCCRWLCTSYQKQQGQKEQLKLCGFHRIILS